MSRTEQVDKFFKDVSAQLDTVYETVYGALDSAMVEVDKVLDEVRKAALEAAAKVDGAGAGPVKIKPTIVKMKEDISNWYTKNGSITNANIVNDPRLTATNLEALWDNLPDSVKSWSKRDKNSPL